MIWEILPVSLSICSHVSSSKLFGEVIEGFTVAGSDFSKIAQYTKIGM
jgi:hypothetical protein